MKVLVTGADGFVGQHLVSLLLDRGHEVIGGIRGHRPELVTLSAALADAVEWISFDLRSADSIADLVQAARPDAIVHLAGLSSVSESWGDPETTFDVNAGGALRLLKALRGLPEAAAARPVVLVSSGEVYGADGSEDAPLTEAMPLHPVTPYGVSKAAQEMLGAVLRDPAMRLVHARSFQQIGPGQRPTFVTVDWARQLLDIRDGAQPPVLRVGNLDIHRDFLDVRDGAAAYVAMVETPAVDGAFNVCSGRSCSLRRLLELLGDAVGVRPEIRVERERLRPAEIRSLVGSPRRLMQGTDWRPRIPLEESVRTLVASLDAAPRPA